MKSRDQNPNHFFLKKGVFSKSTYNTHVSLNFYGFEWLKHDVIEWKSQGKKQSNIDLGLQQVLNINSI